MKNEIIDILAFIAGFLTGRHLRKPKSFETDKAIKEIMASGSKTFEDVDLYLRVQRKIISLPEVSEDKNFHFNRMDLTITFK